MANQSGGPNTYTGTGNLFNGGSATGTYTLIGTQNLPSLTGSASATVASGTTANVAFGAAGISLVTAYTLIAGTGAAANITSTVGVSNTYTLDASGGAITLSTNLSAGLLDTTTANISNNGTFTIGATVTGLSGVTVAFGTGGGTFQVASTTLNLLSGVTIDNFNTPGARLDIAGVSSISTVTNNGTNSVVTFNNGQTVTLAGVFTQAQLTGVTDGSGGLVVTTCFLAGTLIATPQGGVAVETLKAGDLVTVLEDGAAAARPIKWVGSHEMHAAAHGYREEAFPVRVRAGAFGENLPERDLLVTGEHCIFVDGGLVPVRMLVNGASILFDREMPDYTFYHVELEQHGILLAEGLPTESYIDTGNRALFDDTRAPVETHLDVTLAAPLAVDRATVEPIWQRLNARASALGLKAAPHDAAFSVDPELRVLLDNGDEIEARMHAGLRYLFDIPRGARPVALLSKSDTPAGSIGPFLDDRRRLGVKVSAIVLLEGGKTRPADLADASLEGWHLAEPDGRWTDGRARLDLDRHLGDEALLDVRLAATLPYRPEATSDVLSLRAA